MNTSKSKQQRNSKRIKTQGGYSAFDDSVVFIAVTKIQKCLYDISKSNFNNLSATMKVLNKDINVISDECKDKMKISLLMTQLVVFECIYQKRYEETVEVIEKRQKEFTEKTNPVIKLSIQLMKSLLFRYLNRQEQSKSILTTAIAGIDLTSLKVKGKTLDYKILQSTIVCISIIADYFSRFESHSEEFRQIYTEAYRISHKYLTQYHKLTETLYTICKRIPNKINESPVRKKPSISIKKRSSLVIESNRGMLKQSKSDRSSLNHSTQPKSLNSFTQSSDIKQELRKAKPNRLRTLDPYIDLQEQNEKCLTKLYGMQANQIKLREKKILKRPRLSTSLKTSTYEPQFAVEMKELQSISQIYLPKIQTKRREPQLNMKQKLNAAEVLKYGSSLAKLKPNYFDKLQFKQNPKESPKKNQQTLAIKETLKTQKNQPVPQPNIQQNKTFQPPVKNNQVKQQLLPAQKEEGCQLI